MSRSFIFFLKNDKSHVKAGLDVIHESVVRAARHMPSGPKILQPDFSLAASSHLAQYGALPTC
jgi:hypothetical protein